MQTTPAPDLPTTQTPGEVLGPTETSEIERLAIDLGPIPKEVVIPEGTAADVMRRIAAVPRTRVAFRTVGGNMLRGADVRRLSSLPQVHVVLRPPLLRVHLGPLGRIDAPLVLTMIVPPGKKPALNLLTRMERAGPAERHVVLEGASSPERITPLLALKHGSVTVRLPRGGFDPATLDALKAIERAEVRVRVPASADAADVLGLGSLSPAMVVLETDDNRVGAAVARAATQLGARIRVRLDGEVNATDLRQLRELPRLELQIWVRRGRQVSPALTELLTASEGVR